MTEKSKNRSILKMISSTLKEVKKGKRAASQAARRKRRNLAKEPKATGTEDSASTCSDPCSSDDDMSVISSTSEVAIAELQAKVELLLREMQDALTTYTEKEKELTKSLKYHLDRAKGRYDSRNMTGSVLSMRKVKSLEREYEHVSDAIQFFTFRKLELDRFLRELKSVGPEGDDLSGTVEQQAVHICSSLGDIKAILEEPDVDVKTADDLLLKELQQMVQSSSSASGPASQALDPSEYEDTSYNDETEFDLEQADVDEELVKELGRMAVTASS